MTTTTAAPLHRNEPAHRHEGNTMKAITRDRFGSPDVLHFRDIHRPPIPTGNVLVDVHAAGVNRGDALEMRGWPYLARLTGYGAPHPKHAVPIGPNTELNIFEIDDNREADHQTPMFGRGRLDHIGLRAASFEGFAEIRRRLIELGATDGFVTDFGPVLSLFFTDPDGLEGEVCVPNPEATTATRKPPGTPSSGFKTP